MRPTTWQMGINDEYCWEHRSGGWDCTTCRLEVTLGDFFAGIAKLIEETLFQAFEQRALARRSPLALDMG